MSENVRTRFQKVMHGEKPEDRLPMIEWAPWWNLTVERWQKEGLPAELDVYGVKQFFGLDMDHRFSMPPWAPNLPPKEPGQPEYWVENEADYEAILPGLYPDQVEYDHELWQKLAQEQAEGKTIIWVKLDGFFWWPRVLFGIERHLYAFYDHGELMHRINREHAEYLLRAIDQFFAVCVPDFVTLAEDMSFNFGPMIGKPQFDEFLAPYYRQVLPKLKEYGTNIFIDSDGAIESLIPWFEAVGIEGILPLERMAGVDVNRIRAEHPKWKMIGGFDKTIMHLGEEKIREEFERLLPAMRSGYYVPSVDHQTPPAVSIEDYRLYRRLLEEYTEKACH